MPHSSPTTLKIWDIFGSLMSGQSAGYGAAWDVVITKMYKYSTSKINLKDIGKLNSLWPCDAIW